MSPKVRSIVVLLGTFVLGGVGGAFGMQAYHRVHFAHELAGPPGRARMHFRMAAMTRQLDLTRDQRKKIEAIFEKHEGERRAIFKQCAPGFEKLRGQIDSEIRAVLNADQQKKFDAFRAAFAKRHGHPHPPPPPRH